MDVTNNVMEVVFSRTQYCSLLDTMESIDRAFVQHRYHKYRDKLNSNEISRARAWYVTLCVCVCVCAHTCVFVHAPVCMYICMCTLCVYVHVCVCVSIIIVYSDIFIHRWQYAITCVLEEQVRRKLRMWSWSHMKTSR